LKKVIDSNEHEEINYKHFTDADLLIFNESYKNNNLKYLGIHQEFQEGRLKLLSNYYIGYSWFKEDRGEFIRISPKLYNNKSININKIFYECLSDVKVSSKMLDSYSIYFNQKWIEIEESQDEITPILIIHFLKILKRISQKGLKKGYIQITENITSQIKGRVRVDLTIRHNFSKARLDKNFCQHQIFTHNCLENQILKTALIQCSRFIFNSRETNELLRYNLSSFEGVDSKNIYENDFLKIKLSSFFKEYKEAFNLAKLIFKRLGYSLNSPYKKYKCKIPPYFINMPELFERFVEVQLRKNYPNTIDGNRYQPKTFEFGMKPDFLIPTKKMILDAKYKYWYNNHTNSNNKDDFQQLALYGRAKSIRKLINLNKNEEAKLVFIFPAEKGNISDLDNFIEDDGFSNITKVGIQVPFNDHID